MTMTIRRFLATFVVLFLTVAPAAAQTLLTATTFAAAVTTDSQTVVSLSSATGVTANNVYLFVPLTGEVMTVVGGGVNGTLITVTRGQAGTRAYPVASGGDVFVMPPAAGVIRDPGGACTRGTGIARYSPVINVTNGNIWVCRSSLWNGTNKRLITYNSIAPFTP